MDPIDKARNVSIVDVFGMFDIPVEETRCLIRCYRPENHKQGDKHPSMLVDPVRNRARCFVCDNKYLDSIDVARTLGNFNFAETIRFLSKQSFTKYTPKDKPKKTNDIEKVAIPGVDVSKLNITKKMKAFIDKQNTQFQQIQGNIDIETIKYHCYERRIDIDILMISGIKSVSEENQFTYFPKNVPGDVYKVAIPYRRMFQQRGDVIFFNMRAYEVPDTGRKEIIASNSPLCSFYTAPGPYLAGQLVFICEGYIDALTLASRGVNAISVPGGISSFRKSWVDEFKKRKLVPVVAFDSEPGADRKAYETLNWFLNKDVIGYRLLLPKSADINSFFTNMEMSMNRVSFADTPVTDASSIVVGNIKWNFNKKKQKFLFSGWESRYIDQH